MLDFPARSCNLRETVSGATAILKQVETRLPADLYAWLSERARTTERSIAAELRWIVREYRDSSESAFDEDAA